MDNNLKELHQRAADLYKQVAENHTEAATHYAQGDNEKGNYFAQIAEDKLVEVKKYWAEKHPNSQLTDEEVEQQKVDAAAAKKEAEELKKKNADQG